LNEVRQTISTIRRKSLQRQEETNIRCGNLIEKERKRANEAYHRAKRVIRDNASLKIERDFAIYALALSMALLILSLCKIIIF